MAEGNPVISPESGSAQYGGATAAGTMPQTLTNGSEGVGQQGNGVFAADKNAGSGLSAELAREVGNILHDNIDDPVVKMAFAPVPINTMMRATGSKKIDSPRYKFYSVDMRVTETSLSASLSVNANQLDRSIPDKVTATVVNSFVCDETDIIVFEGQHGYAKNKAGNYVDVYPTLLAARVSATPSSKTSLELQFINANPSAALTIPSGTKIYILGHAAAEEDASTTPWLSLPEPDEQYMQKFMVQSQFSEVFLKAAKEVQWTEKDVDEIIVQQLLEDIEKTFIFGVKSYTFDPTKKRHTQTCSGIIEQMILGGSKVIDLYKGDLTFADLLDATNETFIGNSGSNRRYVYAGCNVAPAIWGIKDVTKMVKISDFKAFNYDFSQLSLLGYNLEFYHHPLFDKLTEYRNWALVIDRKYLEIRIFRSMEDYNLELKKTGVYDGKSRVWCEISSPVLKYPKAHAIWIFHDGNRPDAESDSSI